MAKIQTKPYYYDKDQYFRNRKTSSFLCCFGLSGKPLSEKKSKQEIFDRSENKNEYQIKKIVTFTWSWPRFRKKNPAGIKTVPVLLDSTVSEKPQKNTKVHWSKPKSKSTTEKSSTPKRQKPAKATRGPPPSEVEIVVTASPDPNPNEKKPPEYGAVTQNTNLENRKSPLSGPLHSSKDDTCHRRLSFTRKIDAIRTGSSQPGSPANGKSKLGRTQVVTRQNSDSLPAPNRDKTRVVVTKPAGRETEPVAKRFEPLVGMSVVMVTLVIMVLCGRVCAILCTSAWLYFVPRLSSAVGSGSVVGNGSGSSDMDLGSNESKKKVVLEGFLERNHRNL